LRREVAVENGVPLAEEARAGIPRPPAGNAARRAVALQADVAVEIVGGDEGRVVAAAAGGHRGDGRAALQHVRPRRVEHWEDGVNGRWGGRRRRLALLRHGNAAEKKHRQRRYKRNRPNGLDEIYEAGQSGAVYFRQA